ncbi:MAG: hypothetical protein RLZZ505_2709 [Verrucomicrobiota bacterium]|jgi:hypothetical protein
MIRQTHLRLAIFLFLALANTLPAADIFVTPTGNDANDGKTAQAAFRTLSAACKASPAGTHTIRVAAGEYAETESSVLAPGVSIVGAGMGKTIFRWNKVRDLTGNPMGFDVPSFLIQMKDSADAGISGITIIGSLPDDKRAHAGIVAQGVRNVEIHHCELRGLEFTGVWLSDATSSSVHDCQFDDCAHPDQNSCTGALLLGHLTDCQIHHNTIREKRGAYGIKTWVPVWTSLSGQWFELGRNKAKLVGVHIHDNDIHLRQQGAWGQGQTNMAVELWNSDPVDCEISGNRLNTCVSLVEGAESAKTIRVHHNSFLLEDGYAIEAGHHNLEIDHNVFRNCTYPIASFGGLLKGLNIHHNVFDGVPNIGVCLFPGVENYRFTNNTVVVKKDMPLLGLGKHAAESKDILIADNVLVKEGDPAYPGDMARGIPATIRGNLFWNWKEEGEAAVTKDPLLVRDADGDQLLRFAPKSPARSAGKGAVETR